MTIPNDQDDSLLQNQVEQELSGAGPLAAPGNSDDAGAYRVLFGLLNEKPAVQLPADFSSKVVAGIQTAQQQVLDYRWNFLLPLGILVVLGIFYGASLWFNNRFSAGMLQLFWQYKWQVVFISLCFLAIQYLDHRVKKRSLRQG